MQNNIFTVHINHYLEYYQTDNAFYFRWKNVNEDFMMPIDFLVNAKEVRVFPTKEFQYLDISKHSQVEIMDWKFYVLPVQKNI